MYRVMKRVILLFTIDIDLVLVTGNTSLSMCILFFPNKNNHTVRTRIVEPHAKGLK